MSDRWFIYKDGQALGPFAPEEIRQSLREGTFDPFDLVSREGSSVRRELVEVDELFFTSKVVYAGEQASGFGDGPVSGAPSVFAPSGNLPAVRGDQTQASQRGAPDVAGNGHLALASSSRATLASQQSRPVAQQNAPRKRRRDPKHFHVMDPRGRVLGPVSASEIHSLFYKGVLDKDVKVMRDGSRAQVPVARFVAIYSESNRVKRAMQQGAHPIVQGGISRAGSLPAPRVAMGTPSSAVSPLAVIAIVAALLFGGIAAYVFIKNGGANWSAKDRPSATRQNKAKKKKVRPLPDQKPKPWPSLVKKKQKADRLAELKRQRAKLLELKQRREAREKKNGKSKLAKKEAAKAKLKTAQLTKPPVNAVSAPKPPPVAQPKPSPAPAALPSPAAPLPKAPAPAAPAKAQGQTVASLTEGQQVQKLGPMTFDKTALAECDGSCNLTFSGAGGSVKAAFFKQVWGPALEGKTGGVYLSGLVKKNGDSVKIILSNVQ